MSEPESLGRLRADHSPFTLRSDLLAKTGHFSSLFAKSEPPPHAKTVFSRTLSRF